ncbi:DNA-binding transcriptional regulator, AcrR family [Paenibacillus catalpae]|uniref:DNA-binding transcriptional regulator, AcrR family n=1 Tax=Paenibacillus catalpae TaxID=1045775 RepID=A0A1I2HGE2_9BACL|nr:TetR family transcriptional regulator [Paenibacillus catalpae]SFF28608.1 DNA-binding transcriptional regulator, AcrR family [Paenibacillus catalpae]
MTTNESDVKSRILLAARKLFASQGFEGTTVRQICEEAGGANVALISYHFGGKENMFAALFDAYFPSRQFAEVDLDLPPVEGVKLVISEVTKFRYSDPELVQIIQHEVLLNTARIEKIRFYVMPLWQTLRKWLEIGREQGVFQFRSTDLTLFSIAGVLLFNRHSDYWQAIRSEEPHTLAFTIEEMTSFIMNGLQAKL